MRLDAAEEAVVHAGLAGVGGVAHVDDAQRPSMVGGVLSPGALPQPVLDLRAEIDVDGHRISGERETLRLADDLAALRDEPVPVPREVRGRLPEPRRAVHLDGDVLGRRGAHQLLAVLQLANRHVGGGQVREHGGAGERGDRARRHRRPEVLADVGVEHEVGKVPGADEHVGPEGNAVPEQGHLGRARRGGGVEPAELVELPVVRRVGLGRHGDRPATVERHGAVEEQIVDHEGQPDREEEVPPGGPLRHPGEAVEGGTEERFLEEQIAARVGRESELGAEGVVSALSVNALEEDQVRVGVEGRVGHPDLGYADRHPREAMRSYVEEVVGQRHA